MMIEDRTDNKFYLIFWAGAGASKQLAFNDEKECDAVLQQIIEGKGIVTSLTDFPEKKETYYPYSVLKLVNAGSYTVRKYVSSEHIALEVAK